MPEDSGRTLDYLILRACERLDPRAVFGKCFNDLSEDEQRSLLGFDKLRSREENPPLKE